MTTTDLKPGECSVEGCRTATVAKGYCDMHYRRFRKDGTPGEPAKRWSRSAPDAACSTPGCSAKVKSKGLCNLHYERQWLGRPLDDPMKSRSDEERFWAKVEKSGECWIWTASRRGKGYGLVRFRGRNAQAHRASYEMHNGPIPDGAVVRHKCDNPPCVNPDHLELGTVADNNRDMSERGRSTSYANGTWGGKCRSGRHEIASKDDLYFSNYNQSWNCRACSSERSRRSNQKAKATS